MRGLIPSPILKELPWWLLRASLLTSIHQVPFSRIMCFVGAPVDYTIYDYLLQKQPRKQDRLLSNVPHPRIIGVGVHGLSR